MSNYFYFVYTRQCIGCRLHVSISPYSCLTNAHQATITRQMRMHNKYVNNEHKQLHSITRMRCVFVPYICNSLHKRTGETTTQFIIVIASSCISHILCLDAVFSFRHLLVAQQYETHVAWVWVGRTASARMNEKKSKKIRPSCKWVVSCFNYCLFYIHTAIILTIIKIIVCCFLFQFFFVSR